MKKLALLYVLLFVPVIVSLAQYNGFIITKEEYLAITIKDVSVETFSPSGINVTEQMVQNWFGVCSEIKKEMLIDEVFGINFIYGNNFIHLTFDGKPHSISNIEIVDSTWPIRIRGTEFRVGDPLSKFQQVFGSGFLLNQSKEFSSLLFKGFNYTGNEVDSIVLEFNASTKKVTKIIFYTIP